MTSSKSPMVSVVIPAHNAERFIHDTINSILRQTYDNLEIIVVDDDSNDATPDILREYADKNEIRTIHHKSRTGTGPAMNTGIRAMKGEWLKPFNADDIMYENCIETLVSAATEINARRTIVSAYHDFLRDGRKYPPTYDIRREAEIVNGMDHFELCAHILYMDFSVNTIGDMWHYDEFVSDGMYANWYREDYELRLRLCCIRGWDLHVIPEKVGVYRKHTASKSSMGKKMDDGQKIIREILSKLPDDTSESYEELLKHMKSHNTVHIALYGLLSILPYRIYRPIIYHYRKRRYGELYAKNTELSEYLP